MGFRLTLATNQGVPASEIPPPVLPPPPPLSPLGSPNESSDLHDHDMIANVELENQASAFNVVAEGMFGGFLGAIGDATQGFSRNLDDEIGPF
uniref:Uncharacterized protein n=1 Tax=Leersia perrieri TaxID=77586 RepID=A0A0D9XQS0_9ORYZ